MPLVELPETQVSRLIELLGAMQDLPKPDLKGREIATHGPLWQKLPGFGHHGADEHNQSFWRERLTTATRKGEDRAEMRAAHVRKANVEARLVVAGVAGVPLDWGYECIADALERHDAVVDFEVPAAAEWLSIAGDQLFAGVRTGIESWALGSLRDFGREDPVMAMERWLFWEQRMEELEEQIKVEVGMTKSVHQLMKALREGSN